ncbi:MAG: D-alanyl-D-alanine carboxypeptidase/D-alanyl-D-alanine-endopeptidase [Sporichthyaceae bacterium]
MRRRSTVTGSAAVAAFAVVWSLLAAPGPAEAVTVTGAPAAAGLTATSVPALSRSDQLIASMLAVRATDRQLGSDLAGLVTDATSGEAVWNKQSYARQLPASTTKLITSVNALTVFGPSYRFTTTVRRGTTWGRVALVGAGDPSLSRAGMRILAAATAQAVRAHGRHWVVVQVDDHLFPPPTLATGWASDYMPTDVSPVRALVVGQHTRWDTSLDAGNVFASLLKEYGVRTSSVVRARAPGGTPVLAKVQGRSLDLIVKDMLLPSDNDYAEALHRLVALRSGYPATWAGAAAAQRTVLAGLGIDLGTSRLYDGSGLSRSDRLTARQLVSVLSLALDGNHPRLVSLRASLPVAGRTGTLAPKYLRYTTWPTKCAVGLVTAKTGSLRGVITLAGYARGADGRTKAFALLANGVPSTLTTRKAVDKLATTVTGCW